MSEVAIAAQVLARLGVAVLEKTPGGDWRLAAPPPTWLPQWGDWGARVATTSLTGRFPFLEHFLDDAAKHWSDVGEGAVESGIWTDTDRFGNEIHLEAQAMSISGCPVLVVSQVEAQRHQLLQQARESELGHVKLRREIDKKEVLFHYIVHDLANPLSAIAGSLTLLKYQSLSSEAQELVELGRQSSDRAQRLVRDVMEIFSEEQRIYADSQLVGFAAQDANATVTELVRVMQPAFRSSDVGLEARVDTCQECRVVGDISRLERVLSNFLENALRHSRPGDTVTVSVAPRGDKVRFAVDDQGPGVPEEIQGVLFEKFSQGRHGAGKSGIGLHFCRITVERWGGSIGYERRPEGGSRFWFELPQLAAG